MRRGGGGGFLGKERQGKEGRRRFGLSSILEYSTGILPCSSFGSEVGLILLTLPLLSLCFLLRAVAFTEQN